MSVQINIRVKIEEDWREFIQPIKRMRSQRTIDWWNGSSELIIPESPTSSWWTSQINTRSNDFFPKRWIILIEIQKGSTQNEEFVNRMEKGIHTTCLIEGMHQWSMEWFQSADYNLKPYISLVSITKQHNEDNKIMKECSYNEISFVSEPMVDGMVPLSWLFWIYLHVIGEHHIIKGFLFIKKK